MLSFDVIAFSIFFELNKIHFDEMYEIIKPHLKPHHKVVVGGNYLSHYDHHLEFEDLDVDVVVGPGEPYFEKLFDLPHIDLYSYNHVLPRHLPAASMPVLVGLVVSINVCSVLTEDRNSSTGRLTTSSRKCCTGNAQQVGSDLTSEQIIYSIIIST